MRNSFQRRLLVHLAIAVVFLGLLGAAAQFVLAWRELRESQDDMLRQVAALALSSPGHASPSLGRVAIGDHDARLLLFVSPGEPAPTWLSRVPAPGLHTVDSPRGPLRVEVQSAGPYTVVVAQSTDARDELAWAGAMRALLPSLLLVPLLIWLISRQLRVEFAPITRAARRLEMQDALREPQLEMERMPSEIQPFVDAIEGLLGRTHALMQQQQRFIADAAHELRSPLTALALQARNVRHAASLDEARARLIPLEQGIERARKLTEQLLGLARLSGMTVAPAETDVSALARDVIAEFLVQAEHKGIDLGLDVPDALSVVTVPTLLHTILSNAVDNAIKYTPAGGEVTLALRESAGHVRLEVIDSGPGIPAAQRVDAFRPFHRLHDNDIEGTGLGLAIAREAATRIGATLGLHDRRDRSGLVFVVDLPDAMALTSH